MYRGAFNEQRPPRGGVTMCIRWRDKPSWTPLRRVLKDKEEIFGYTRGIRDRRASCLKACRHRRAYYVLPITSNLVWLGHSAKEGGARMMLEWLAWSRLWWALEAILKSLDCVLRAMRSHQKVLSKGGTWLAHLFWRFTLASNVDRLNAERTKAGSPGRGWCWV